MITTWTLSMFKNNVNYLHPLSRLQGKNKYYKNGGHWSHACQLHINRRDVGVHLSFLLSNNQETFKKMLYH